MYDPSKYLALYLATYCILLNSSIEAISKTRGDDTLTVNVTNNYWYEDKDGKGHHSLQKSSKAIKSKLDPKELHNAQTCKSTNLQINVTNIYMIGYDSQNKLLPEGISDHLVDSSLDKPVKPTYLVIPPNATQTSEIKKDQIKKDEIKEDESPTKKYEKKATKRSKRIDFDDSAEEENSDSDESDIMLLANIGRNIFENGPMRQVSVTHYPTNFTNIDHLWKWCDSPSPVVENISLSFSPLPLQPGVNGFVKVSAVVPQTLGDLKIHIRSRFNGIVEKQYEVALCDLDDMLCPLEKGSFEKVFPFTVPRMGNGVLRYQVTLKEDGESIGCINISSVRIGK